MPPSPNMGGMHMTTTTCSWRPYRVALRTQECRGVISLYLEPTDGALPPAFAAGQYVELRSLLNEATRDFYSRLNTATLETLTNSDEIREIISGKDLLRAQPDAPTPPSSELIRLMEARVARELRKARQ